MLNLTLNDPHDAFETKNFVIEYGDYYTELLWGPNLNP